MTAPLYSQEVFEQAKMEIERILEENEASRKLQAEIKGPSHKDKGLCYSFGYLVQLCIVNDKFFLLLKYGTPAEQHAALAKVGLKVEDLLDIMREFPAIKTDLDLNKIELPELPEPPELPKLHHNPESPKHLYPPVIWASISSTEEHLEQE